MTRFRHRLAAVLVGLSLTVPVLAACSDCCPRAQVQPTVVAPPTCCGQCAPTLEKPETAATLAAKKVMVDPGGISIIQAPVVPPARTEEFEPVSPAITAPGSRPSLNPLPLRL